MLPLNSSWRIMPILESNPASLYLPLLNNPDEAVRRQAYMLLLSMLGERGLTLLRRLLDTPDVAVRQQAREALLSIADLSRLPINQQPFQDMYIECLGLLRLYINQREVRLDEWVRRDSGHAGWQKVQSVLGYLVHCGRRGATRATLGAAVWGGAPPAAGVARTLNVLRQLFAELRDEAFAEQALLITDEHCTLNPDVYLSDVNAFEQASAMARHVDQTQGLAAAAPMYAQAMHLYGGPYMLGVAQSDTWALSQREQLRGSFLNAAGRVAEQAYAEQRYRDCVAICGEVFDSDESAAEIAIWLLRAYHQLGRWGDLEQTCRRYLRASRLDRRGADARTDPVVREYHGLAEARVVGE